MSPASEDRGDRLSLQTLVISSLSAGAAAIVVPLFWERGTLFATAITPVIVALVSEALRRPAERIGEVVPTAARRTAPDAASRNRSEPVGADARRRPEDPDRPRDAGRRRRRLRRALATGLLAFGIAAVVVTASELSLFGGSVTGDGDTTLFDDDGTTQRRQRGQDESPPSPEPEATSTATPEATSTPTPTPTSTPAPDEATPSPTPTPAAPAPSPTEPVP